jgi:hypothetical protein
MTVDRSPRCASKRDCDCLLHQLTPEELIATIDAAIDATNAEVRANGGTLPDGGSRALKAE